MNHNLILGPRPKHASIIHQRLPVHTIICLLKANEGANDLGVLCRDKGYEWVWWPLDARPHSDDMSPVAKFVIAGKKIAEALKDGSVYVHCAAGIHRTGMAAYSYYRLEEHLSAEEARDTVIAHRNVIGIDAKEKLDWLEEQIEVLV